MRAEQPHTDTRRYTMTYTADNLDENITHVENAMNIMRASYQQVARDAAQSTYLDMDQIERFSLAAQKARAATHILNVIQSSSVQTSGTPESFFLKLDKVMELFIKEEKPSAEAMRVVCQVMDVFKA
jgi:hypothetical protein